MKKIVMLLLCMVVLLSGCAGIADPEETSSVEQQVDVWETIEEAYTYACLLYTSISVALPSAAESCITA